MTTPAPALEFRAWFRSITLENPKWIERAEREVRRGDKQMIRLLMGYLPVLPPDVAAQVVKSAGTLKTPHKDVVTG